MDKTKRRRDRIRQHADRLSRYTLDGAGRRRDVARALGRPEGTVSHECTSRANPDLARFFTILLTADTVTVGGEAFMVFARAFGIFVGLLRDPSVTARAFAEACMEAVELREIVQAADEVLLERVLWLIPEENRRDSVEDDGSMVDQLAQARALHAHGSVVSELAASLYECDYRGIDAHAINRARQRAVA